MTSSEERQIIAEKMRGPFDVCKYMGHTCISGTLFGMQMCAMNERSLRDSMRRLADRIDPTCHLLPSSDGGYGCDRCYTWFPSMKEKTNYCPHCGARVIERAMDLRRKTKT